MALRLICVAATTLCMCTDHYDYYTPFSETFQEAKRELQMLFVAMMEDRVKGWQ